MPLDVMKYSYLDLTFFALPPGATTLLVPYKTTVGKGKRIPK